MAKVRTTTVRKRTASRFVAVSGLGVGVCAAALLTLAMRSAEAAPWGIDSPAGRCVVCHSLERGGPFRVAPNLYGIVGAEKARDREWYGYSLALMTKGGVWSEEELDQYLADAAAFAPGSTKTIRIPDPAERRAIIDFLKKQRP